MMFICCYNLSFLIPCCYEPNNWKMYKTATYFPMCIDLLLVVEMWTWNMWLSFLEAQVSCWLQNSSAHLPSYFYHSHLLNINIAWHECVFSFIISFIMWTLTSHLYTCRNAHLDWFRIFFFLPCHSYACTLQIKKIYVTNKIRP
jgi:hypothetical protein